MWNPEFRGHHTSRVPGTESSGTPYPTLAGLGEGKRDVTDIAGGGGAEARRFSLVASAHSENTMVNPWVRPVIFGH